MLFRPVTPGIRLWTHLESAWGTPAARLQSQTGNGAFLTKSQAKDVVHVVDLVLRGETITLRGLRVSDAEDLYRNVNDPEIGRTSSIPYPYPGVEGARFFIQQTWHTWKESKGVDLGITLPSSDQVIGMVGMFEISRNYRSAEIGYWVGRDHWGHGYATEGANLMIRYGFEVLGFNRIQAVCFDFNPRSARVLEKAGMRFEGRCREELIKDGNPVTLLHFAILRRDWQALKTPETLA